MEIREPVTLPETTERPVPAEHLRFLQGMVQEDKVLLICLAVQEKMELSL